MFLFRISLKCDSYNGHCIDSIKKHKEDFNDIKPNALQHYFQLSNHA